jgi:hypothetical protein
MHHYVAVVAAATGYYSKLWFLQIARNDTKDCLYMVIQRINIRVYVNLKGKKHLENVSYCKIE